MSLVKIIFFDIDGTLIDPKTKRISEKTKKTLALLRQRGIKLCVATGRPIASLPDLSDLHFDAFCTSNGSLCYTEDSIIYNKPIPPEDVITVIQNATAIGRSVSAAVRERLVANGLDPDLADYYRVAGLELTVADDFEEACKKDVYQLMVGCRKSDHTVLTRNTKKVKVTCSWDRAVDIIPTDSGKAVAIEKVLSYFQLDAANAIAFGDSFNDLDMLQSVGIGIAMGNAPDELKKVAAHVCGSVADDGIYHYCVDHGLI